MTTVTFTRRATVADLVRELVSSYRRKDDQPAGHRCTEDCTHDRYSGRSLLDRLGELAEPTQQLLRDDAGNRSGARKGSPAPWSAPAAELLDEILRGSIDLARGGRTLLEWPDLTIHVPAQTTPARWGPAPPGGVGPVLLLEPARSVPARDVPALGANLSVAGRVALRGLPGLLVALQEKCPQRRMVNGLNDEHGVRTPGYIEESLRTWHRKATQLTGHVEPWRRLPQIPNPDLWSAQPRPVTVESWRQGPVCEDAPDCDHGCADLIFPRSRVRHRWQPRHRAEGPTCDVTRCWHDSCARLRARTTSWLPWRCPHCRSDSLRLDPVLDVVHCIRPSCSSSWSASAFEDGSVDPWGDTDDEDTR